MHVPDVNTYAEGSAFCEDVEKSQDEIIFFRLMSEFIIACEQPQSGYLYLCIIKSLHIRTFVRFGADELNGY